MNKSAKLIFQLSILVGIIAAFISVWFFRYDFYDWYQLRSYEPPERIVQLAERTTMTTQAKRYFYIAQPEIQGAELFRQNCPFTEQTIVLGCYLERGRIYLYDVQDPRLRGIMEVTAAHEMLHVVYSRMNAAERQRIDALTSQAFAELTDGRIESTIERYRERDAGVVPNELHSILGTEVRNLPSELEEYYSDFFDNRLAVVEYSEQYEAEFANRQDAVARLDSELEQLKAAINQEQSNIDNKLQSIRQQQNELSALLQQGRVQEHNDRVVGFNASVDRYNESVRILRQNVERYNRLVQERNNVALEIQDLVEAIDNRMQPLDRVD